MEVGGGGAGADGADGGELPLELKSHIRVSGSEGTERHILLGLTHLLLLWHCEDRRRTEEVRRRREGDECCRLGSNTTSGGQPVWAGDATE